MPKTLITGAASGIGRALAQRLYAAGHELVLVDRTPITLAAATCLVGDVSNADFWDDHAARLDGITHAAVNAGVAGDGPIADMDFGEWRRVLSVNLDGAFLTLRAALRAMRGASGPRAIVVTASISGIRAEPGTAAYAASKAGAIQLARVAAREGAADQIRVNAIAPGGVDTPIWDAMPAFAELRATTGSRDAAIAAMAGMATPLGRFASAGEIAAQIAFLLSDDAASITGAVLCSDGGYSL